MVHSVIYTLLTSKLENVKYSCLRFTVDNLKPNSGTTFLLLNLKGLCHCICIIFKKLKRVLASSKIMLKLCYLRLYLGIEIVSC